MDTAAIVTGLLTIAGGALVAWITARAGRRKNDSDAAKAITDAATALIQPLERRVRALEDTNRKYAKRIVYLMDGIKKLIAQIKRLGHEPDWTPDDWSPDDTGRE